LLLAAELKRLFDTVAALAGLCLLLPVLLVIAIVIRVTDGAPVLYQETRLGRHGLPFQILKFSTLREGSAVEPHIAPEGDPRITECGRWLRRWRLDEFPQLFNVIRGDMSLVGPRPLPAALAERLSAHERKVIFSVRPGITDPAAIHFLAEDAVLAGQDDAEAVYFERFFPARIEMAMAYVATAGFLSDMAVLVRTLALLWSRQAREQSAAAMRSLLAEMVEGRGI
jgi:lipopolysaccharide/colanic/teichoic acid biosynthesis glycosyltransferase